MDRQFQLAFNQLSITARVLSGPDYISIDLTDPHRMLDTIFLAMKTSFEQLPMAVSVSGFVSEDQLRLAQVLAHKTSKTVFVCWGIQSELSCQSITILGKLLYEQLKS